MAVRTEVVEQLARIDLADTTRPGGIRARVEEAADLIREHVETVYTGRTAPVIPITTTANRSAA